MRNPDYAPNHKINNLPLDHSTRGINILNSFPDSGFFFFFCVFYISNISFFFFSNRLNGYRFMISTIAKKKWQIFSCIKLLPIGDIFFFLLWYYSCRAVLASGHHKSYSRTTKRNESSERLERL